MTQTTESWSMVNAKVEISSNGTTWTDISGFSSNIEPDPGKRQSGEVWTYSGDKARIEGGKKEPLNVKVSLVYTEGSTDPYNVVLGYFDATGGTKAQVRWSPKGGTTGNYQFTADSGVITEQAYPSGEPQDGKPIVCAFTLRTPGITKAAAA